MNKKLKIIIPAIVVVIVAIVGVLLVVNNNQTEQVKGTTTEVVKTTLKEDKATTTEKESEKESEIVTDATQIITKAPETTKKTMNNSSGSFNTTTKPPVPITTKPVVTQPTTTKPSEPVDISVMGNIERGDTARAGLFYTYDDGKLTTYDEIPEGSRYYYYDSNGNRDWFIKQSSVNQESYPFDYCKYCSYKLIGVKPNADMTCPSCKNFIDTSDFAVSANYCAYCGKNNRGKIVNGGEWIPPHTLGGCSRFSMHTECDVCGKIIPAHTCFHGCGISH